MKAQLLMLACLVATTCGSLYCDGFIKTVFQYAFFAVLVGTVFLLLSGVGD